VNLFSRGAVTTDARTMKSGKPDIDLRLDGRAVSRCLIDYAFSLEFLESGVVTTIRIGGKLRLKHRELLIEIDPEDADEIGRASLLVRKTVDRAVAREDGSLEVSFTDGTILSVSPQSDYEAWEAQAADGMKVVSLPGGGLSIWGVHDRR